MSLAMFATATLVVVEVGVTVYNLDKAGAFNKFKKKLKKVRDFQVQPDLRRMKWSS